MRLTDNSALCVVYKNRRFLETQYEDPKRELHQKDHQKTRLWGGKVKGERNC